jgi:transcriptional regulator with XRE-family HTH domain
VVLKAQKRPSAAYPKQLKTWGEHIRNKRLDLGLTQSDVARQLGVTESTVWNWESNATSPTWRSWKPIMRFLGYSPMPQPTGLAGRLLAYRKLEGLSQKVMASRLGIDPGTLGQWERGARQPKGRRLALIARTLGVNP